MEAEFDTDDILDLLAREAEVDRSSLDLEGRLNDLGIASLQMISVLFAIEDRYKVTISPEEMQAAETLADLVNLARARMRSASRP